MKTVSPSKGNKSPASSWPARKEFTLLALILMTAVTLRVAHSGRMTVEHFDEGVYASNLSAGEFYDYRFPNRHLFAPPLLPALAEWSQVACGRDACCMMLANLLAGCLTVVLTWWVARGWFGRQAGLAAAALSAMSDFHVLYSRTLLTDPLLGFWMLLAVYLIWRYYRHPDIFGMLLAGLATALAWWTKYNGWLPLAIGLAGLLGWMVFERPPWEIARKLLLGWCGIAIVAFVAWSPVLWDLPTGGYAAVAENHRRYFVGLSGWFDSLLQQRDNLDFLSGWLSRLSPALALLAAYLLVRKEEKRSTWKASGHDEVDPSSSHPASHTNSEVSTNTRSESSGIEGGGSWNVACMAVLVLATTVLIGSTTVLALAAMTGIAVQFLSNRTDGADCLTKQDSSLATWLVAAWFLGMLLSTPLYRPYPRIALPWLMAAWLGTSAGIPWAVNLIVTQRPTIRRTLSSHLPQRIRSVGLCLLILIGAIWWKGAAISARGIPGWQNRTGLESIATEIVADARTSVKDATGGAEEYNLFYIYAEPSLFFHLAGQGVPAAPIADLSFVGELQQPAKATIFLLTGPQAHHDPEFLSRLDELNPALERVATYDYKPSDFVLLNRYPPRQLASLPQRPIEQIRMFRLR